MTVVAVIGAAGGCGASTLACGLALAWATSGRPAWLVELDPARPDLAGCWDLPTQRTIADLAPVEGELSCEHLDRALVHHESGVAVLLAPPVGAPAPSPSLVKNALALAAGRADVAVDLGPGAEASCWEAARAASTVLVAAPVSVAGARRVRRAVAALGARGAAERARLVALPSHGGDGLAPRSLARAGGLALGASLPRSPGQAAQLAAGRWPRARRRGLAAAVRRLAEELA